MLATIALSLGFERSAYAQCHGEQIDTFAAGSPTPYIATNQNGTIAIRVANIADPSLGLFTCFATNITVTVYPPDANGQTSTANPITVATGIELHPGEKWLGFRSINVANLNPGVTYAYFQVGVTGLAEGQYSFSSSKTVGMTVAPACQ
jgi:hypothetical protein